MEYDSESGGGAAMGASSMQGLLMQNSELRRKLEEQNDSYKSKLAAYQEGQTKQTEIVKKLQQKVSHSSIFLTEGVIQMFQTQRSLK